MFATTFSAENRTAIAIGLSRTLIGGLFLWCGLEKLSQPDFPHQMRVSLELWTATQPLSWYAHFLKTIILPHASLVATMVTYGEIGVGIGWLTGFMTSTASIFGLILTANYFLASQHTGLAAREVSGMAMLFALIFLMTDAGRFYGLDRYVVISAGLKGTGKTKK